MHSPSRAQKRRLVVLGKQARALRNAQRWSLETLGERVGLSAKHLSKVERGLVNVSFTTLHALFIALGADADAFLFRNAPGSRSRTASPDPAAVRATVAANLRYFRGVRDLSQVELADMAGISAFAVGTIEHESHAPNTDTLTLLAQALGVRIERFFQSPPNAKLTATAERKTDPGKRARRSRRPSRR